MTAAQTQHAHPIPWEVSLPGWDAGSKLPALMVAAHQLIFFFLNAILGLGQRQPASY